MSGKPDKSVLWLGKYLSLALSLPASVVAGYIVGAFAERHLHWSFLPAIGIALGFAGGLTQILRELSRDEKRGKSK
jgi:F0F1-type ATP synthase assembly protein I